MAFHLRRLESLLTVTPQRMRMIVDSFIDTLERGLQHDKQMVVRLYSSLFTLTPAAHVPDLRARSDWTTGLISQVFGWPSGKEVGQYLAIDLGGTNLRVCLVDLEGEGKFSITQTKYKLTEEQKQADGEGLFDFCAECLASFIRDHNEEQSGLPNGRQLPPEISLGFTFSCAPGA